MIFFILLILISVYLVISVKEPRRLTEVRERYSKLRQYIKTNNTDPRFTVLAKECILVGFDKKNGDLGYNTNKGYEIGLCLDGTPNEIFHVLIHELAHNTVEEYTHSKRFWKNFSDLKELCIRIGVYEKINEKQSFCGRHIKD